MASSKRSSPKVIIAASKHLQKKTQAAPMCLGLLRSIYVKRLILATAFGLIEGAIDSGKEFLLMLVLI